MDHHQESYSEEVYEILRDFLPQIQKQIRQELQTKIQKTYEERYITKVKQFEEEATRKFQEHANIYLKERQAKIKLQYERLLENKLRQVQASNQQELRRFKNEYREKKSEDSQKDQQIAVLLQQKANWEKLQKQYQLALKELGTGEDYKQKVPLGLICANNARGRTPPGVTSNSSQSNKAKNHIPSNMALKIDIPKERRIDIQADMGSELFRKDDNASDYSSLLSPPHIEQSQLDRRKGSLKQNLQSQKKKPLFWNEEKKKQLLDMIRKRIM